MATVGWIILNAGFRYFIFQVSWYSIQIISILTSQASRGVLSHEVALALMFVFFNVFLNYCSQGLYSAFSANKSILPVFFSARLDRSEETHLDTEGFPVPG